MRKKRIEGAGTGIKDPASPKDPNDEKNVIVEIRAGAGGDEEHYSLPNYTACMCITESSALEDRR